MPDSSFHSIHIGGDAEGSVLVTGSGNIIVQAEQVLLAAAQAAQQAGRDPARLLRILALLAAPVYDPDQPDSLPPPLDLKQEWHELAQAVRESLTSILLARIVPPTLDALRRAPSPRAKAQALFPHVLHFSGHAWKGGLLLEDELGQVHAATTDEILDALRSLPGPVDLVVLNGCESAADARSVAQALAGSGLARAAVGHPQPIYDPQAVCFAAHLYAELADGFPLREALDRARRAAEVTVTSGGDRHLEIVLLGDPDLRFGPFTGGEPWIDDRRPPGNLPSRPGLFFGQGPHLVEIAEALAHPPKVVVLSGPAAIGKTSLALEAAHRNAWRFPGGVAFAEGPRPEENRPGEASDFFNRLAEALNLSPEVGRVAEALALQTDRQPVLLVLDNLETLSPPELERVRRFLERLGPESAAILLARPPQKPLEDLPCACAISLHEGIGTDAATLYALRLAGTKKKGIALTEKQAREIVQAADGHPRLVELLVAQAGRRDLAALLREVRERRGDFQKQLEKVYDWSAWRLEEKGQLDAWRALLLFPGGVAPELLLRAAACEEGPDALRDAALADYDNALQAWRWHPTVGEYARLHWPLSDDEHRACLSALLPEWTAWLAGLPPKTPETASRLEVQQANLESVLEEDAHLPPEPLRNLLRALHRALPAPDRTLALRSFEERVYRTWAERATEDAERAEALNMLGYALFALGRQEEALAATEEAVGIYRQLAAATPQAFLPDLAMSLNNLGEALSALGRWEEALAKHKEAVRILTPFFLRFPTAFVLQMNVMLSNYLKACQTLGRKPDEELLRLVREHLEG